MKAKSLSFIPITISLILFVASMLALIANEESLSQNFTISAYFILIVGIVWQFIIHLNKEVLSEKESF